MTYRCRTCSINYPIRNEYQKCPVCQEDTSMMTFTWPDEDWEWKATLLLAKVTPAEFEGPVPQLPVNAVQDNNGQFWLSAKELIAKGFSRRLRFEEVIELPAMPPGRVPAIR